MSAISTGSCAVAALMILIGCVAPVLPPEAPRMSPHRLSSSDLSVIRETVAAETLVPGRARVTNVAAAISPEGNVMACGYVSGIEFSGLYGPERAFSGILATNVADRRVFAITGRVAQTQTDQIVTHRLCEQEGIKLGATPSKVSNDEIKVMIADARALDGRCRGSEGADPASSVCEERDKAFRRLNENGWCYGKVGEVGYLNNWHWCEADSIQ